MKDGRLLLAGRLIEEAQATALRTPLLGRIVSPSIGLAGGSLTAQ
jgi:hypothetical protein